MFKTPLGEIFKRNGFVENLLWMNEKKKEMKTLNFKQYILILFVSIGYGQLEKDTEKAKEMCEEFMHCLENLPSGFSEQQFLDCARIPEQILKTELNSESLETEFKEICSHKLTEFLEKTYKVEKGPLFLSDSILNKHQLRPDRITQEFIYYTNESDIQASNSFIYAIAQGIDSINSSEFKQHYDLSQSQNLRGRFNSSLEKIYIKDGYFKKSAIRDNSHEALAILFDMHVFSILIVDKGLKNEIIVMHTKTFNWEAKNELVLDALIQMEKNSH